MSPRELALDASRSDLRRVLTLVAVTSVAVFGFVFGNEAEELNLTDLAILLACLAMIIASQTVGILIIFKLLQTLKSPRAALIGAKLIGATCIACNAYFTTFITYESGVWLQVVLSAAVGGALLAVMFVRKWQPFTLFVMSAYFLMSAGLYGYTRLTMDRNVELAASTIRVNSSRNVYFIGNESLPSPAAYRELHGIRDLPHVDYLRENGFRVLDRAYSAEPATIRTYARMLEFEHELSENEIWSRAVFNSMNSTFAAFDRGNYRIQFIYKVTYFGLNPDLVDYAFPERSFSHCEFAPQRFFYVLCEKWVHRRINRYIFGNVFNVQVALDRIRAAARSDEPWLTIYHHAYPFHAQIEEHSYSDPDDVRRFRNRVRDALPRIRQENFETVIATILREDPDAVIITYGDHGPQMTLGADLDAHDEHFTRNEILEDRFGVLLAVYPASFCTNRVFEGSTTTYLVENVIRCLNGDDSPTAEQQARSRTFYWDGPRSLDRYIGTRSAPAEAGPSSTEG